MSEMIEQQAGSVLIFSGPHGAGKDTLENEFRRTYPATERVVRHITRSMAPGEVDGSDYHYVDTVQFEAMVGHGEFVEYSTYPDCMAGTAHSEVTMKLERADFASVVTNFEEGIVLHRTLGAASIASICFFISPVSHEVMQNNPSEYLAALRSRMEGRGRPSDRIANKLAKAALYREEYLRNASEISYVNNSDACIGKAIQDIGKVIACSLPTHPK